MARLIRHEQSVVRRFQVILVVSIILILFASIPSIVAAQSSGLVSFEDQRTTGHDVYVDEIVLTHGGWVDIQTTDGEVLWTNRGLDELPYFEAGESYGGWVDIAPALTHNQTLTAVVYNDTNQNRVYDAGTDEVILQRNAWMTVQIVSGFETSAEGWEFVRSTNPSASSSNLEPREPVHRATGGSPEGYLSASDGLDGSYWDDNKAIREWRAPSVYLGDRSNFYGGTFSFDARGSVDWETCAPGSRYEDRPTLTYDVSFYSGDQELRYRFINPDSLAEVENSRIDWYGAAPGAEWSRYTIPIRAPVNQTEAALGNGAGRWDYYEVRDGQRGSFAAELTESTFRDVFSDLDRIEIQGESVNELRDTACEEAAIGEEGHLDTVVWNTVPPTDEDVESSAEESTTIAQTDGSTESAPTTYTDAPGFSAIQVVLVIGGIALLTVHRNRP